MFRIAKVALFIAPEILNTSVLEVFISEHLGVHFLLKYKKTTIDVVVFYCFIFPEHLG